MIHNHIETPIFTFTEFFLHLHLEMHKMRFLRMMIRAIEEILYTASSIFRSWSFHSLAIELYLFMMACYTDYISLEI